MADKDVPTRDELKKLKVTQLRHRLSKLSLPQAGLKDDLITRLIEHYQAEADAKKEVDVKEEEVSTEEESGQPPESSGQEDSGAGGEEQPAEPVKVEPDETEHSEETKDDEQVKQEEPVDVVSEEATDQQQQDVSEQVSGGEERGGEDEQVSSEPPPQQEEEEGSSSIVDGGQEGEEMEVDQPHPPPAEEDDITGRAEATAEETGDVEVGGAATEEHTSGAADTEVGGVEQVGGAAISEMGGASSGDIGGENTVQREEESEPQPSRPAEEMTVEVEQPRPLMGIEPRPLMESQPRPLMEAKPPAATSDYYSASDATKDEEVSMATEESKAADETTSESKEGKRKKKKKRRRRRHDQPPKTELPSQTKDSRKDKVEVEYIQEDILKPDDPYFRTFFRVFENFRIQEPEVKKQDTASVTSIVAKAALESKRLAAQRQDDSDDDEEEEEGDKEQPKISKKKLRRMNRLSVAQLKQLVERPDVVEMHDVTAPDPQLLIHLKSTRNTVPVPRHWCFKRKYLQGKRGIEKPPFDLPDFIKATGVMEMRQAVEDKEDAKSLKQKTRERVRPKMGKLTIDYFKLHDAFFKWQTKPKMSIHGDIYYEGKEFETRLRQKKPGDLSDELRRALGMPTGLGKQRFPPPWLVAMQRYGPPPSYPNLKIPGLNSPIPEGCSFGYFVGGWGKPPVDERGRPLYGDVFGLEGGENASKGPRDEEDIDQTLWGELESEEEEEESEEEEEEEEGSPKPEDIQAGLITPVEGLATPSGLTSIPAGLETPEMIQLRKKKIEEAMEQGGETPALYTVLPEKAAAVGGSMMGSSHVYDMASAVPGALKKASGSSHDGIEVALDPSELDLDTATMSARYEEQLREQQGLLQKEDLSDMVAEHAAKQKKRKRPAADSAGKATKKLKEFKF